MTDKCLGLEILLFGQHHLGGASLLQIVFSVQIGSFYEIILWSIIIFQMLGYEIAVKI
jgi:hypothetical protein